MPQQPLWLIPMHLDYKPALPAFIRFFFCFLFLQITDHFPSEKGEGKFLPQRIQPPKLSLELHRPTYVSKGLTMHTMSHLK